MANKNASEGLGSNALSTKGASIELCYQKDNIWLYCGDNVELMKTVPDGVVDLTVTSPPYDDLRTYTKEAAWNWEKFCEVAKELYRITAEGGVVVWNINDSTKNYCESGNSFKQALYFMDEAKFNLHDTMIWHKNNPMPTQHTRYENSFEYMFIFSKGKPKTTNILKEECKNKGVSHIKHRAKGGNKNEQNDEGEYKTKNEKIRHNVWLIPIGTVKGLKHSAPFPEALAHDHILSWSNEGDLVFDPFHGSGTTGKMCKKLNRKFFGIDIAREYVDIQIERIDNFEFEKVPDND